MHDTAAGSEYRFPGQSAHEGEPRSSAKVPAAQSMQAACRSVHPAQNALINRCRGREPTRSTFQARRVVENELPGFTGATEVALCIAELARLFFVLFLNRGPEGGKRRSYGVVCGAFVVTLLLH